LYEETLGEDVVALIVDVDQSKGSVWFRIQKDYIGRVGQDHRGGFVVVTLEKSNIKYMCIKECRIGKVFKESLETS
jgi:hypothetical protein